MEDPTFWISFISILSGLFVVSLKYCLKSKCDQVECLCFKIHRNTAEEVPELDNPPSPSFSRV